VNATVMAAVRTPSVVSRALGIGASRLDSAPSVASQHDKWHVHDYEVVQQQCDNSN